MKELSVSVVLVGPEFSSYRPDAIGAETTLQGVAALSIGISLSMSAEASAAIYTHLRENYPALRLEEHVVDFGESRAAMIAQIRRIYLECFGLNPLSSDLTDPNLSERAFTKFGDSLRLLKWPVRELIGATAVGISHAAHGELGRLNGTVPMSARYMTGALIGTGPALFSGEEALGASYTDYAHPQFILNFKGSGAAQTRVRRENYKDHHNTAIIERRGCHLSLAYYSVLSHALARNAALGETWHPQLHQLTDADITMIHASKPSKKLEKIIQMEKAA